MSSINIVKYYLENKEDKISLSSYELLETFIRRYAFWKEDNLKFSIDDKKELKILYENNINIIDFINEVDNYLIMNHHTNYKFSDNLHVPCYHNKVPLKFEIDITESYF